jgi:hypothetical protein
LEVFGCLLEVFRGVLQVFGGLLEFVRGHCEVFLPGFLEASRRLCKLLGSPWVSWRSHRNIWRYHGHVLEVFGGPLEVSWRSLEVLKKHQKTSKRPPTTYEKSEDHDRLPRDFPEIWKSTNAPEINYTTSKVLHRPTRDLQGTYKDIQQTSKHLQKTYTRTPRDHRGRVPP